MRKEVLKSFSLEVLLKFFLNRLRELELHYRRCGWRVTMLTETAVSDHFGWAYFHTYNKSSSLEVGARLEEAAGGKEGPTVKSTNVKVVRYKSVTDTLFFILCDWTQIKP